MPKTRLERIVDALDGGASVRAVAKAEGITPPAVRYFVRRARKFGMLVKVDGKGRHKFPAYRRPRTAGPIDAPAHTGSEGAQPVGANRPEPLIPRSRDAPAGAFEPPDDTWRHIEDAWFEWDIKLAKPALMTWDPASERMQNGTRWRKFRHSFLGQVWGTVQIYSNFRAVLHLDKMSIRWADMAHWNDMLWKLAYDAQARVGRDLADLGTSVSQTAPEPQESPTHAAARAAGEPVLITGNLYLPVDVLKVGQQTINAYVWADDSPPGAGVETPGIRWAHVADHLPDRVIALETWQGRLDAKLDALTGKLDKLDKVVAEQERIADQLTRVANLLERLLQPREPEPTSPAKVEKSKGPGDYVG